MELDRVALNAPMAAREAAAYLGVGIDMLARFEKEGLVTHRLTSGPKAQRRWYRADLDAFVQRPLATKGRQRIRCSENTPGDAA